MNNRNSCLHAVLFLCSLLAIIPACSQQLSKDREITFNIVPPVGQQSTYEIRDVIKEETKSKDSSHGQHTDAITARLETRVTATKSDGTWTLSGESITVDWKRAGASDQEASEGTENLKTSFTVTMDSHGRILNIPENVEFGAVQRDVLLYRNPIVLLPIMMLPAEPARVGSSWPIDVSLPIPDSPLLDLKVTLTLKGTGTLKAVEKDQALIDFTFTSELRMTSSDSESMIYVGKGVSSVAYDLKNARFVMNKIDMTRETVGFAVSDNDDDIKSIFEDSLQLNLVNK